MKLLLKILLITISINITITSQTKKLALVDVPQPIPYEYFQYIAKNVSAKDLYGIYFLTNIKDLRFGPPNSILKSFYVMGGYIVFINKNSTRIEITSNIYKSLIIDFLVYGLQFAQSNYWLIKISEENYNTLSLVFLGTNKKNYDLFIDGIKKEKNKSYFLLTKGYHNITYTDKNVIKLSDTIKILNSEENFTFNFSEIFSEKIIIKTNPSGARVFINGIEESKSNLTTFRNPGKYKIKLVLNGYYTIDDYIEVKKGKNNTFNYLFTKSLASLKIDTEPENVNITINGKPINEKDIEFDALGTYVLEIERPQIKKIVDTIVVNNGDRLRKKYNLLMPLGTLLLIINPSDAILKIDGKEIEKKDTLKLEEGTYNIMIEKDGYEKFSEPIHIKANEIKKRVINLKSIYGYLYITVTAPGYRINIIKDNKVIKEVYNRNFADSLLVGKYLLEVTSGSKFYPFVDTIVISKNVTKTINVNLKLRDSYDVNIVKVLTQGNAIKNLRFQKKGYYYEINYDLSDNNDTKYNVKLYLVDKSQKYERLVPLEHVYGDINEVKGPGKNKVIRWDFINEYPQGIENNNLYLLLKSEVIKKRIPWYIYTAILGGTATYFIIKGKPQINVEKDKLPPPPKRP
ncbi:PEGA domain-containing protein [Rosettibacter firmus]|uniref:PEGA domain-containing protein n=1 Tax=Rosettibacter firmus TaxID=3111522 RepID=UPI00336C1680